MHFLFITEKHRNIKIYLKIVSVNHAASYLEINGKRYYSPRWKYTKIVYGSFKFPNYSAGIYSVFYDNGFDKRL